jgi:hypothetical protein
MPDDVETLKASLVAAPGAARQAEARAAGAEAMVALLSEVEERPGAIDGGGSERVLDLTCCELRSGRHAPRMMLT